MAAVDAWRRRAEAEEKTLTETPRHTNHEIVAALWRKQAALEKTARLRPDLLGNVE